MYLFYLYIIGFTCINRKNMHWFILKECYNILTTITSKEQKMLWPRDGYSKHTNYIENLNLARKRDSPSPILHSASISDSLLGPLASQHARWFLKFLIYHSTYRSKFLQFI